MSQKASGFERQSLEKYYTPAWVSEALLSREALGNEVWEPAAGAGDIANVIRATGAMCLASDIEPTGHNVIGRDFFDAQFAEFSAIVTNPPYGKGGRLAVEFIARAIDLMMPRKGKVAMLLRVDFDSANGRRGIFGDHPAFKAKYVLTKRIRWTNLPQSAAGPTENHAWFVWDWKWAMENTVPTIGYLP